MFSCVINVSDANLSFDVVAMVMNCVTAKSVDKQKNRNFTIE